MFRWSKISAIGADNNDPLPYDYGAEDVVYVDTVAGPESTFGAQESDEWKLSDLGPFRYVLTRLIFRSGASLYVYLSCTFL